MDITFERNRNYKEIVASNYKEKSKILEAQNQGLEN